MIYKLPGLASCVHVSEVPQVYYLFLIRGEFLLLYPWATTTFMRITFMCISQNTNIPYLYLFISSILQEDISLYYSFFVFQNFNRIIFSPERNDDCIDFIIVGVFCGSIIPFWVSKNSLIINFYCGVRQKIVYSCIYSYLGLKSKPCRGFFKITGEKKISKERKSENIYVKLGFDKIDFIIYFVVIQKLIFIFHRNLS